LHCAHDELAVGDLVKLSRHHNHAPKLKRENQTEKQFFTFDCAIPTARHPERESRDPDALRSSFHGEIPRLALGMTARRVSGQLRSFSRK
jgi:hypothetical protein